MIRKYATATIIGHELIPADADDKRLHKAAHRVVFDYVPRPGYLYVRSRMISSRCNDNHDEFPAEEIKAAWKTAIGKPAFVNHHNEDHRRMRGVIIDAALHEDVLPTGEPDIWIEALHEVDAIRFPKLAQSIIEGRVNRTSMGCDVGFSVCSACGNKASTPAEYCEHIPKMKGKILYRHTASGKREGHLIREICHKLSFFENSFLVEDPADPTAVVTGIDDRGLKATARSQREAGFFKKKPPIDWMADPDRKVTDLNNGIHVIDHLVRDHGWSNEAFESASKAQRGEGWRKTHDRLHREGVPGVTDDDSMHFHAAQDRKDPRFEGVSLKEDDDGWYVHTHRARSKSYKTPEDIPDSRIEFIRSTGVRKIAVPQGLRFRFTPANRHPSGSHVLQALLPDGNEVGSLKWSHHSRGQGAGMVDMIKTHPDYERQGIASALWRRAHEVANEHGVTPPVHSDVQFPAGKNWAEKVDRDPVVMQGQEPLFSPPEPYATTVAPDASTAYSDVLQHLNEKHPRAGADWNAAKERGMDLETIHATQHKYIDQDHHHGSGTTAAKTAALPNDMRFTYSEPDDYIPAHRITVDFKARNGRRVKGGHIWWHPEDGSVIHIQVPRKYQGSGIASALWQRAHELSSTKGLPTPVHSNVQTPQGKDWAASVDKKGLPTMPGSGQQELFDIPEERKTRINSASSLPSWPEQPEDYIPWKNRPEGAPAEDAGLVPNRDKSSFVMKPPNWEPGIQSIDPEKQCVGCGADLQVKPYRHMQRGHADYGFCTDCQRESGVTIRSGEPGYVNRRERSRSGVPRETKPFDPGMISLNTIKTQTEGRLKTLAEYEKSSLPAAVAAGPAHSDPAEHPFFKANPVSAENVINSFMRADDGRRAQGMRWYSDAHHLAGLIADGDHAKGAGVLAAYSPKAAWPDNMFNAARSLRQGTALGKGEGASVMGMHQKLAQKVMDGEHHSKVMKSPKISDFAHLIEHGDDTPEDKAAGKTRVVVDRHALSVATGRRMTTQDLQDAPLGSRHYYEHVAQTYRDAADHLTKHLGVEIKPHQVQAVTWGVQQEENERADEAAAQAHARGRATRTKNSWTRWEEHSKEQYPVIHKDPPNLHAGRPYDDKDEQKTGRKEVRASSLPSFRGRA